MSLALFWVSIFIVILIVAMLLREQVKDNAGLRAWYERVVKDRLDLLKTIVGVGTLVLWVGIWMATRGDEKASVGNLLKEISNSWSKIEEPASPVLKKE